MPFSIQRILVPTDFSDEANRAVPVAFALARLHDARVLLAHVLVIPDPVALYAVPAPAMMEELKARALAELKDLVPRGQAEVPHELHVRRGTAADELCKLAQEERVSLITMASHGRTGLSRFLLGSITERVVRHAPCSVMVVRRPEPARKT